MMYGFGIGISPSNRLFSGSGIGASYLLDTYGSSVVAYSLRKVSSTYTGNIIRVRRSSDNAEQDITLSGDLLDTTSLLTFVGVNDGHIVSWYDQSGNDRTILQSTGANQPKIVSSGSLITGAGGFPAIVTDGTDFLQNTGFTNPSSGYTLTAIITVPNLTASQCFYSAGGGNQNQMYHADSGSGANRYYDTSSSIIAPKLSIGSHLLTMYDSGSTTSNAWEDGVNNLVNFTTLNAVGDGVTLFKRFSGSNCQSGTKLQEIIQFDTNLTSQINDLNTDINNYYSIY